MGRRVRGQYLCRRVLELRGRRRVALRARERVVGLPVRITVRHRHAGGGAGDGELAQPRDCWILRIRSGAIGLAWLVAALWRHRGWDWRRCRRVRGYCKWCADDASRGVLGLFDFDRCAVIRHVIGPAIVGCHLGLRRSAKEARDVAIMTDDLMLFRTAKRHMRVQRPHRPPAQALELEPPLSEQLTHSHGAVSLHTDRRRRPRRSTRPSRRRGRSSR